MTFTAHLLIKLFGNPLQFSLNFKCWSTTSLIEVEEVNHFCLIQGFPEQITIYRSVKLQCKRL